MHQKMGCEGAHWPRKTIMKTELILLTSLATIKLVSYKLILKLLSFPFLKKTNS